MSPELPSYDEAAALVAEHAKRLALVGRNVDQVKLRQAAGRVLARALRADQDQPAFARSTRDGFACRAAEASSHDWLRVTGATRAGDPPAGPLERGAAWEIMTGAPVPRGANCVAMIEHVGLADGRVRLLPSRTLEAGENIVARGAQARKGQELLAARTAIGAAQIALAAACGRATLEIFARPRVAILATGDELVPVEKTLAAGQIRNSNAPMLAAMVAAAGGTPWVLPIVADTSRALDSALAKAADADLLLITGGVSAGKFDLVEPALERTGARFHFTGVKIQPGKPTVFGERPVRRGPAANSGSGRTKRVQYFFGLPGNPVSTAVTFLLFGATMLGALAGTRDAGPRFALVRLSADLKTKRGLTRFLPAACTFAGATPEAAPVGWQGSGDIAAMARANCFLVVPEDSEKLDAGSTVRILLM